MSHVHLKKFEITITCSILLVVSGLFHGCFRCNLMVFQECYWGVSRVLHGCRMGVSRVLEGSHVDVKGVLHMVFKCVTRMWVLKGCHNGATLFL